MSLYVRGSLQPSTRVTGRYTVGDRELTSGDLVEVQFARSYHAGRVEHEHGVGYVFIPVSGVGKPLSTLVGNKARVPR